MTGKPKNLSQAIEDLEEGAKAQANGDFQSRIKSEFHRIEEMLQNLRPHVDEFSDRVGNEAKKAKGKAEEKILENPWATVGLVGLIFFVLGFLLAKRKD